MSSDNGVNPTEEADNLGPHANEKHMPQWLRKVLESGDQIVTKEVLSDDGVKTVADLKVVETPNIISALVQLSRADVPTSRAIYCSPLVHHVARLRREGSFCGYRNIQMMVSYIRAAQVAGHQHFDQQPLPSIFRLQEMIEEAWKQGFNSSVGEEVGPLKMTRKFIGTSEVEALFLSLSIPVITRPFVSTTSVEAYRSLVDYVFEYFDSETGPSDGDKVVVTSKAPIFLQRPGHSVTIVGVNQDTQGSRKLIVFDPHTQPSKGIRKLALGGPLSTKPHKLLKAHQQGETELAKYPAFEIVQLGNAGGAS